MTTTAQLEQQPTATQELTLVPLRSELDARWDAFVALHAAASPLLSTAWKRSIERTFGFKPLYVLAMRGETVEGVLPLFETDSLIGGRCLISTPFGVAGGICATSQSAYDALLAFAIREAESRRVQYLELRHIAGEIPEGFHHNQLYSTFRKTLLPSDDENMKALPRDTRYMIRKAIKAGLRAEHRSKDYRSFYQLMKENFHHHGTPVFGQALIDNIVDEFKDKCSLTMIYQGSDPVAGVLNLLDGETIYPYYAGAHEKANQVAGHNFLYWEVMRFAIESNLQAFDFGRSKKNTGAYSFKSQWNMDVIDLQYAVKLVERKSVPNFSPANPTFGRAAQMWRKLPKPVAGWLGPKIVRWFP